MKFTTVLSVAFSLILLSACNSRKNEKKISDLESKIEELQKELQTAKDPATIDAIQKQLREAATQKLEEMKKQKEALMTELKKTTDRASCDKLRAQAEQLEKDINKHILDNLIPTGARATEEGFACTESGYTEVMGGGL